MKPAHRVSYLSNQAPRTFAPKPRYAAAFWRRHGLPPPYIDVHTGVSTRARRYLGDQLPTVAGRIVLGDSRDPTVLADACGTVRARWIITSPPYYGLRTYVPDQWLRSWFLGGPPRVDYSYGAQVSHRSPDAFIDDLRRVWINAG